MIECAELHSHLYGCLTLDDLAYLASVNKPRWNIFEQSYQRAYGTPADISNLFASENRERARQYYHGFASGNFDCFQAAFDLIIAVSSTSPDELPEVVSRVTSREPARYAEYRQLFSPRIEPAEFKEKLHALCEGFEKANRSEKERRFTLAISIPRDQTKAFELMDSVRQIQAMPVGRFLVGVDFCAQEEGYPPSGIRSFIESIQKPSDVPNLAILYHVGESFRDKSIESAVRWVWEASEMGSHRLGHAIALGINPSLYLDSTRDESVKERIDQIEFELDRFEELKTAGATTTADSLRAELNELKTRNPAEIVSIYYDSNRVERVRLLQDWAMHQIKIKGTIIECCPSSNIRIAGLKKPEDHPVHRFIQNGIRVVIGADDPGILDSSLKDEFQMLVDWGITQEQIDAFKAESLRSRSEILMSRAE